MRLFSRGGYVELQKSALTLVDRARIIEWKMGDGSSRFAPQVKRYDELAWEFLFDDFHQEIWYDTMHGARKGIAEWRKVHGRHNQIVSARVLEEL